jgi:hypothetical protein
MTAKQAMELKPGDKLIITRGGGGVSWREGNVFTFANTTNSVCGWPISIQFKELHERGNHEHNIDCTSVELFDQAVHKEFRIMDGEGLQKDLDDFHEKYG